MKGKMAAVLLLNTIAAMNCGTVSQVHEGFTPEIDGVFAHKVGQFEVFMLVEAEREGNAAILVGADENLLRRYIPETGFTHTANAFLIKTPGQNILIDTGTGAGGVIIDKIKKLGVEPDMVDAVMITHLHRDHFGGLQNAGEASFPKAKVYVPAKDQEHFTSINEETAAVMALYGNRVTTFEPIEFCLSAEELLPGIIPIASYGHTPGHTIYIVKNSGERLMIAGDFLHVALVQFANPDISATFDLDPIAAAASRKQLLENAADCSIPIGGMHIVYPGIGTVEADGDGYRFTPMKY